VRLLDIKSSKNKLSFEADFVRCNIEDINQVKRSLRGLDVVIHVAIIQIPFINQYKRKGYEVNVLGFQNVCEVVKESKSIKGLILAGSWHVLGERGFKEVIDEEFGFRPDKLEDRAKYYALTKLAQETIARLFDEMSEKVYGTIRMGTVLGERMPEKTAANIFITNALRGEPITPFKHSLYRPMFYVDINDVCRAFHSYVAKILNDEINEVQNSIDHTFNLAYPKSLTILELATIVKDAVEKISLGKITPKIEIIDTGAPLSTQHKGKEAILLDITKIQKLLGIQKITSPRESIERIIAERLGR
jgi:UDP-glucose 4-epimerase